LIKHAVLSRNKVDPLEEVSVGVVGGAVRLPYEPGLAPYIPRNGRDRYFSGESVPLSVPLVPSPRACWCADR